MQHLISSLNKKYNSRLTTKEETREEKTYNSLPSEELQSG